MRKLFALEVPRVAEDSLNSKILVLEKETIKSKKDAWFPAEQPIPLHPKTYTDLNKLE
jgi:hypothetical protein